MNDEIVTGAKAIAAVLGRSERWLHYQLADPAKRDKLPDIRVDHGGHLRALRSDLVAWVKSLPRARA